LDAGPVSALTFLLPLFPIYQKGQPFPRGM
jgi:hypothetical protein